VLVFHGYLLRGTGSNVYNANIAAALVGLGHEVHLVCQERHARELDFVGAVADWDGGELAVARVRDVNCTVYRPDIGGLLPTYVRDRYEGVEARPFPELTDVELDAYLEANVRAVREVVARSDVDVALANHLVMGPAILARALAGTGIPYAVKIHGSALEYTVKPHPCFLPYAREGLAEAKGVLVGSRHIAESLWEAVDDASLPRRTRLGPPGVDTSRFRPRERGDALAGVQAVASRLVHERPARPQAESAFTRNDAAVAGALRELAVVAQESPLVAFVGKLILAKGIDLLLAAWPLVLSEMPNAHLGIIGFGAYHDGVRRWIDALSAGDLGAVHELAVMGRAAEGGPQSTLRFIISFLERLQSADERERYMAAGRKMHERVLLTGRLEHDELAEVLPLSEAIVVPSTFPESFGMVAVEAAACGALPISAAHSGLAEVSRALAPGLPEPVRELTSFGLGSDAVRSIATRVTRWLSAPAELRDAARAGLVETAAARYSWQGVARGVVAAARGELELLEQVA
jgi:glycosyltransferase involved in cell wall biosynthesis